MSGSSSATPVHASLVIAVVLGIATVAGASADAAKFFAEATSDSVVLRVPEVVVSATRSPRDPARLPGVVRVVDRRTLLHRLPRTPTDAVAFVPGVMAQKTSPGQGSPYLRGFTGFRTLHLIDGVRLNNSVYRDGPNQYWGLVDVFGLERVEVLLGPASVLYGSDGIGGALNAISRPTWPIETSGWHGNALYRSASAEASHFGRVELAYADPRRGGVNVATTLRDLGELRGGADIGRQPYTGYDELGTDARTEVPIAGGRRLVAAYQDFRQNAVPRTHATVAARSFAGTTVGTDLVREFDQTRQLAYVQLRPATPARRLDLEGGLSFQRLSEDERRIRSDRSLRFQGLDARTYGGFVQARLGSRMASWTLGAEHYHDLVDSYSNTDPIQGPVADDATYDLGSVFLMSELDLSPRTSVLSGVRYTRASADANQVHDPAIGKVDLSDRWDSVVGNVRCGHFSETGRAGVFLGLSQAFRAPNLSDLTRFDIARTSEMEIPAPGLDPERFHSAELGVRVRTATASAEVTVYRTWIRGLIVRRPTGRMVDGSVEVSRANSADGYVQGIETEVDWRPAPFLRVRGQVGSQQGMADQFPTASMVAVREPLSRVMPGTGRLVAGLRIPGSHTDLEWEITVAARQDRLSSDDRRDSSRIPPGGTPGYTVHHLRASLRPHPRIGLTFALENLANQDYRVHGSGSNEPGRNVVASLLLRF